MPPSSSSVAKLVISVIESSSSISLEFREGGLSDGLLGEMVVKYMSERAIDSQPFIFFSIKMNLSDYVSCGSKFDNIGNLNNPSSCRYAYVLDLACCEFF